MAEFQVNQVMEDDVLVIQFKGTIDEDVKFPLLDGTPEKIRLDLNGIRSINSCGIREWVKWITPVSIESKVSLVNCPKVIVDQINMVDGFLPKGTIVDSFYVPYYCEDTDDDRSLLLVRGRDYEQSGEGHPGRIDLMESTTFEGCEGEYDIDVIESKYFKFLGV